ncbi:related to extracellular GDSL-like lipase/acylhydrolase [Cephalotrichum gorgonifer]|uniref:Related to extracellular GDSL-like lipase/acylhydrolase n=1 Tax=Cephalotrichum gorgonifer TaxID=2041049 RepID=A0AAE8MZC9_9PEZI|nr:related to extracellular GDSL-like lipase/acylhydrolase [Cephalotrichum gorgonifer]
MRFLGSTLQGLTLLALTTCAASAPSFQKRQNESDYHWVPAWTSMPQLVEPNNLPPAPFTGGSQFQGATLRQTLRVTVGAERLRIQISNTFGASELPITAATLALPTGGAAGVGGIDTASLVDLTFDGKPSVVIPAGQVLYSDPIDFLVESASMVTLSLYLEKGQQGGSITGHPGARTASWMVNGNAVSEANVAGGSTLHWYFVSGIEIWAPADTRALIILGDSITDGRGSEDNKNNRWPDLLLNRMQAEGINNIAIGNQAAGGNAVLSGGLGPTLLSRYKRDALDQPGVKYVLIFEGVNDLGNGPQDQGGAQGLADRLIDAYKKIIGEAKALGYVTIGATITPFSGQGQAYGTPGREAGRKRVNEWIMTSGEFDHAVDFAAFIGQGDALQAQYDGGDHLHPNVAGYQAIADKFPLEIFTA